MAAKGRKEQAKGGDEADAASPRARRIVSFGRGELRRVKRRMNKRVRREAGEALRKEV